MHFDCLDDNDGCSHIVVPAGCTLEVENQIAITDQHEGLHLEIKGTIKYTGTPSSEARIFMLVGAIDILVDGGGMITSDFDPELNNDIPSSEPDGIARVFAVVSTSSGVTIRDLTITNMGTVLEVDNLVTLNSLTMTNVHASGLVYYGSFVSNRTNGVFRDCTVSDTLEQHGFRLYASGGVTLENCWAYHNRPDKTGLWIVDGNNARIDRFSSNRLIIFGPDPTEASSDDLTNVFARDLRSTQEVLVEVGVDGACLVNLCTPVLRLGRDDGDVDHNLPLDHTHWDELDDPGSSNPTATPHGNHPMINWPDEVHPIDYNYCFADIDRNEVVDVDDMVAVILGWGACAAAPSGYTTPRPPCPADIVPHICGNDAVDVDDLIEVILAWGACPSHPQCGAVSESSESLFSASAPTTAQECYEQCLAKYPEGGQDFINAYEKCVDGLILAEMLEP